MFNVGQQINIAASYLHELHYELRVLASKQQGEYDLYLYITFLVNINVLFYIHALVQDTLYPYRIRRA